MDINNLESLGKTTRAVGLAGELEIMFNDSYAVNIAKGEPVFFEIKNSRIPYFIAEVRQTGDRYRIKFDDIDSQDQAKQFINLNVFVIKKKRKAAEKNEHTSIIGYKALDKELGDLGQIAGIQEYPGQQVLEINYNGKEVLLPITPDFILDIDHKNAIVHIQCPDGLLDVYE